MIKAKHNILAEIIYRPYVKKLLKKNFNRFILTNGFPDIKKSGGLIITPNHFSWWDGFFAEYLMRRFTDRKLYIMMLEDQLIKYPFFKYLGAFSIKQESISSISESLRYAKEIAKSDKDYLVFYPQGEIMNYEVEYIKLKSGLSKISNNENTGVVIVSFKIVYGEHKKPDVFCRFHEKILTVRSKEDFSFYEKIFLKNLVMLNKESVLKSGTDLLKN